MDAARGPTHELWSAALRIFSEHIDVECWARLACSSKTIRSALASSPRTFVFDELHEPFVCNVVIGGASSVWKPHTARFASEVPWDVAHICAKIFARVVARDVSVVLPEDTERLCTGMQPHVRVEALSVIIENAPSYQALKRDAAEALAGFARGRTDAHVRVFRASPTDARSILEACPHAHVSTLAVTSAVDRVKLSEACAKRVGRVLCTVAVPFDHVDAMSQLYAKVECERVSFPLPMPSCDASTARTLQRVHARSVYLSAEGSATTGDAYTCAERLKVLGAVTVHVALYREPEDVADARTFLRDLSMHLQQNMFVKLFMYDNRIHEGLPAGVRSLIDVGA